MHTEESLALQEGYFTDKYFHFLGNCLENFNLEQLLLGKDWAITHLFIYLWIAENISYVCKNSGYHTVIPTSPESHLSWQFTRSRIEITCMRHMGFTAINSLAYEKFVLQKNAVKVLGFFSLIWMEEGSRLLSLKVNMQLSRPIKRKLLMFLQWRVEFSVQFIQWKKQTRVCCQQAHTHY